MKNKLLAVFLLFGIIFPAYAQFSDISKGIGKVLSDVGNTVAKMQEAEKKDKENIEKLHQLDITATLSRDQKALSTLWIDTSHVEPVVETDVVKWIIKINSGRDVNAFPGLTVISYVPVIKETERNCGWAFEWGSFQLTYQVSSHRTPKTFQGKMLRILKRETDGSWKFARILWNPWS
jgi:hypothetical protein